MRPDARNFFRFSIRQFLVLVVCLAVCVAVNRNNSRRDLAFVAIMLLGWVVIPAIVINFVRSSSWKDRPGPPD